MTKIILYNHNHLQRKIIFILLHDVQTFLLSFQQANHSNADNKIKKVTISTNMVITFKQETAIHYISDIIKLFSSTKMLY